MEFNWSKFTEKDYKKYIADPFSASDYIGATHVGDISIDLINYGQERILSYDFYVLHEDTGYGYKDGAPYDYADGGGIDTEPLLGLSYEEFKKKAEETFINYMNEYDRKNSYENGYSLIAHANKPLEMW